MTTALVLRIGRGSIRACVMRRRRTLWAGETQYCQPDDVTDAIAEIAGEPSLPARPVRLQVVLEPPLVQLRTLRGLPRVRRHVLRSLVALQAGRFFRRNGKPLVTDVMWGKRSRGDAWVARAAAVEEPWVEAIAAGARAAGLRLDAVVAAGEGSRTMLELVSTAELARRRKVAWLAIRRLATVVVASWAIAIGLVTTRVYRESQRIDRELTRLRPSIQAVVNVRRHLTEATRMVETIERAERARGAVLARLATIVGALPDSVYLTSFSIDTSGTGNVTGAAKYATKIVMTLERADVVDGPRLVGPAVREVAAGREWERFTIGFGRGSKR